LRVRDKAGDAAYLYEHLDAIEIGDGRRVTCHLKFTDYLWPHSLAAPSASIIPRNRNSDFSLMPVGSGPFKVTRRSEYRLTLTVFEDYYRERALLDEIDLWVIAPSEERSAFDLHFGYTGSSSKTEHQVAQVLPGCTSVSCNSSRPLLASAEQRLALADWLAPSVLIAADDESRQPASGLLPDWQHRVAAPRGRPPIPEHTRLTMVTIGIIGRLAALTESIKERLKEAKIELDVVALSVPEYLRYEWLDSADLVLQIEPINNYADLDCYGWFSSNPILQKWSPPARRLLMDKQLRAIRATADGEARMQAYAGIGKQLVMEGLLIPISHEILRVQAAAHVGGVKNLAFGLAPFADLWLR
jgi:SgrR family transcriptional regulator